MTELLGWFNPTRWLLLAALAGALTLGYVSWADHEQDVGDSRASARYELAIGKQKRDAAAELAAATRQVKDLETKLLAAVAAQEDKDESNRNTVAGLERRLAAAAGAAGQLRDPNAAGCGRGGTDTAPPGAGGAGDRAGDAPQAGGLLSVQLTGLLQRLTREADEINDAYISCRAYVGTLTDALHAWSAP